MSFDVSNLLSSVGIDLERAASAKLGAAVEDFSRQQLSSISGSTLPRITEQLQAVSGITPSSQDISNTPSNTSNGTLDAAGTWESVQYAADLSSSTFAPKHRFLFKVHFHFNAPYVGGPENHLFSYLIKEISRPKISFDYQDVNMYNFRTKVMTNVKHDSMSMTFYDDIGNSVQDFFNYYQRAHSPISRTNTETASAQFETSGMDFKNANSSTGIGGGYSAAMGSLNDNAINVLHFIELEQYFAHGTQRNIYKFINPRIESFDFDDATVDGQELHSVKVNFNYDAIIIDTAASKGPAKSSFGTHDIMGATKPWTNQVQNAQGIPNSTSASIMNATVDQFTMPGGVGIQTDSFNDRRSSDSEATSFNDRRSSGQESSNSFSDFAGGLFSNNAVTSAISGVARNAANSFVSSQISGLESTVRKTLFGASQSVGQAGAGVINSLVLNSTNKLINQAKFTGTGIVNTLLSNVSAGPLQQLNRPPSQLGAGENFTFYSNNTQQSNIPNPLPQDNNSDNGEESGT